jgi:hypothetical protein
VHDDGKTAREIFKCAYCEREFKRNEHLNVHQTKSKCVVMRAKLANLRPEEVKMFRELVKKGYAGTCIFCQENREKLQDHVWRKHQPEMRQLYSRINENERLKARDEGRPYDKGQQLLSKRKCEQEELIQPQSVRPEPNLHELDFSSQRYVPSQLSDYDWMGNLRSSLKGTLSTVQEPSYHVNSRPLELSAEAREVVGAQMLQRVADDKCKELAAAHIEFVAAAAQAEQAHRKARDINDRAFVAGINAKKLEADRDFEAEKKA